MSKSELELPVLYVLYKNLIILHLTVIISVLLILVKTRVKEIQEAPFSVQKMEGSGLMSDTNRPRVDKVKPKGWFKYSS